MPYIWSDAQSEEFESMKKSPASDIIMAHFEPYRPTTVTCDASQSGLRATLGQIQENGDRTLVSYASRYLNAA
ncbi:MAG: ribonuclease H family protein [Bacteroidota bacterium]